MKSILLFILLIIIAMGWLFRKACITAILILSKLLLSLLTFLFHDTCSFLLTGLHSKYSRGMSQADHAIVANLSQQQKSEESVNTSLVIQEKGRLCLMEKRTSFDA